MKSYKPFKLEIDTKIWTLYPILVIVFRDNRNSFGIAWLCFGFSYRHYKMPSDATPAEGKTLIGSYGEDNDFKRYQLITIEDDNFKKLTLPLGNKPKAGNTVYVISFHEIEGVFNLRNGERLTVLAVHDDGTLYCKVIREHEYRFVIDITDVSLYRDDTPVKGYIQDNTYYVTKVTGNV